MATRSPSTKSCGRAIDRSVHQGFLWGGAVLVAGVSVAGLVSTVGKLAVVPSNVEGRRRRLNKALIYDWNRDAPSRAAAPVVMLDDETLRDGLQSPSVRAPSIDQKLRILHLLDRIGIDTADIGLPGAGPHVVRDVERLAREIVDCAPANPGELRRAHGRQRHPADRRDRRSATGLPIECCCFIGSSPIRRYAEDWTVDYLQRCTEEAVSFGVRHG